MPTLSPADLSVYRAGQPHIRRYVSVAPRTSVYTATISAIVSDADTGGIHQLTLTGGAGVLADVRAGFTVDLGTTAGARDVGQLRVRRTPTGAALDVGETAPGVCPAAVGQHITVRRERRVWRTLPRIVASSVGTAFPNTFTAYADYDIAYTNQNDAIQPHANITTDAAGIPVRPAGFVDVGQSYRTVMLHAGTSVTLAHGAAIAAYAWDVGDGTITVGSPTSAAISARFPAGFRYIALTVTDTNGAAHTRYLPVWTHDAAHPPLTAFRVVRDVRSADAGRAMTLEWFGADASLDAAAFPEGAALCYWEIAQFGASAVGAPASHTDALLGWALRDAETLRIADQARLRVEMGGVSAWLDRSAATPQTLRDPGVTATAWDQMRRLTADRAAHYALRQWSSALDLANFYPSGVTDEAQTVTLDGISVWRAAANAAAAGRVGGIGCDALNGVWLRRDFNHLSATERAARPVVVALTSADWTDADGLTVETERLPRVGMVEARGSAWDGVNTATPYASRAPGRTSGQGASTGRIAVQILPTVDAQTTLNALVGHVYAAQNNPRADIRLRLLHPIDALEPAWDEPVTLTWAAGGLRATAISALACRVTRVEIDHDNPAAPKIVRWTLTPTTSGQPGASVPVTVVTTNPPLDPPLPPVPPDVLTPNTGRIAVFCTDNRVYRTTDFLAASPRWTSVNLAVLANWAGGTLLDFAVDAYSPGYIGGGSAVNGWIVTTAGVQRITDIFGTPALGTATALYGSSPVPIRQIQFERGVQNWGIVASYQPATGVRIAYTLNGTTWTEVAITSFYDNGGDLSNSPKPGLWLDPHRAGHALVTAFSATSNCTGLTGVVYETFDYGATWDVRADWDAGDWTAGCIVVPYQDTRARTFYHGWSVCVSTFDHRLYRNATDISPAVAGTPYGVEAQGYGWRRVAVSDVDANTLALVGASKANDGLYGVFLTRNASAADPTWRTLIAPSTTMPYRGVYLAGDGGATLFLIGANGAIGKSTVTAAGAVRIQNKQGNLSTGGTLVGLCGG